MGSGNNISFKGLYPELKGKDLEEAEANFEGYLAVVLRIYERIREDPKAYDRFRLLTKKTRHGTMGPGRNPNPNH